MKQWISLTVVALAVASLTAVAMADDQSVRDGTRDGKGLKGSPEIDIIRATAGHAAGGKLKHKVRMRGRLKPKKSNTRPFLLINTKGNRSSAFEYLVLGSRVFRLKRNGDYVRTGANKFAARGKTWTYRFPAKAIGSPKKYGWAVLTANGNGRDLAPNDRYVTHKTAR